MEEELDFRRFCERLAGTSAWAAHAARHRREQAVPAAQEEGEQRVAPY